MMWTIHYRRKETMILIYIYIYGVLADDTPRAVCEFPTERNCIWCGELGGKSAEIFLNKMMSIHQYYKM